MTLSTMQSIVRDLTQTDATSLANAVINRSINNWYHICTYEILQSQDDWNFQDNSQSINLVVDTQSYTLPSGAIAIERVEITYDGTTWYKVERFDFGMRGKATDTTTIKNDFIKTKPFYDLRGTKIYLYPIPDTAVTSGLKIWYSAEQTELSASTDEPNIDEPFQRILPLGAAHDFSNSISSFLVADRLKVQINELMEKLKIHYGRRSQDPGGFIFKLSNISYK